MHFPHAFTCNTSCVEVSWLWEAWNWKKIFWTFFEKILSHLSFIRETLERWNCGKRAKWLFWDVNRPGEAFRRGPGKKSGQKTAEIDWVFEKSRQNAPNFRLLLIQFSSDLDEILFTHSPFSAEYYCSPRATRSEHLKKVMDRQIRKRQ